MPPNEKTGETPNGTSKNVENPNVNLKIPSWINEEYFVDILKDDIETFSKILSFTTVAGTGAGDNYASVMLRVHIEVELNDGSTKNVSYMLKTTHDKELKTTAIMESMEVFPKEVEMYDTILPNFAELYRKRGKDIELGPRSFKLKKDPGVENLILEDLKLKNFKNANRLEGLDMEHTKSVLEKIAEFHAASACWYEQNGPYSKQFMDGMFVEENRKVFELMNKSIVNVYMDCARKWEGCEEYVAKLPQGADKMVDLWLKMGKIDETEFNVLNHGDCWVNNVMFRYNEDGGLEETCLVDFQMCKYGSPSQDLYYFILSSVRPDIKFKHFDYFIKYYHGKLIDNLKLLEYPKPLPKLKDIHISLFQRSCWAISISLGVLAAILVDPTEKANIENFLQDSDAGMQFKYMLYSNPRYVKVMQELLPWLDNRGMLDLDD